MGEAVQSHRDLIVWQKAMSLTESIYELSADFPQEEKFGMTSQMRRCALSIPSNIAEGKSRGTRKDYRQFLIIARGSAAELETQLEMVKRLAFGNDKHRKKCSSLLSEVRKMLNKMISTLSNNPNTYHLPPVTSHE